MEAENRVSCDFRQELEQRVKYIEELLEQYLPKKGDAPGIIIDAMNYSLLAGGKRLRPVFMMETYRLVSGEKSISKELEAFLCAMEMLHTYSLVHDDLPAMDNDEYRRGRKTTWAVYGDAMGILAGDGLLNYAFETASRAFDACKSEENYRRVARAMQVFARNAGIYGMIGGQVADVSAEKEGRALSEQEILYVHTHKTGALIEASMLIGAILAGADSRQLQSLSDCAMNIGVAFQIQDDILDVVGDSKELGKPIGSDAANGKQTYVTLNGLEHSAKEVERMSMEAVNILKGFSGDHSFLEQLTEYLIHRRS